MRYCGSKARFIKKMLPILTSKLDKENGIFVDAFGGGMNVISEIDCNSKVAIDNNRYVISLWKHLQEHGMKDIPMELTREEYFDIKENYLNHEDKYPDFLTGYVGTCCSYGGAWFNGYAGYNPKRNEDHIKEAYINLEKHVTFFKNLDKTRFIYDDYYSAARWYFSPNTIIYCDPPYASTKKYERDFDNLAFWQWVREVHSRVKEIYISEYEAPKDFKCIWSKKKADGMGTCCAGGKTNIKVEKLFKLKK